MTTHMFERKKQRVCAPVHRRQKAPCICTAWRLVRFFLLHHFIETSLRVVLFLNTSTYEYLRVLTSNTSTTSITGLTVKFEIYSTAPPCCTCIHSRHSLYCVLDWTVRPSSKTCRKTKPGKIIAEKYCKLFSLWKMSRILTQTVGVMIRKLYKNEWERRSTLVSRCWARWWRQFGRFGRHLVVLKTLQKKQVFLAVLYEDTWN